MKSRILMMFGVALLVGLCANYATTQTTIDPKNRITYTPLVDSTAVQYEYAMLNMEQVYVLPDSSGFAPQGLDAIEHYTNTMGRNGYRLHSWDKVHRILIYEKKRPPLKGSND